MAKRRVEFAYFLEMWSYIVRHKLQKTSKHTKQDIKTYVLEWDDGTPEPIVKTRKKSTEGHNHA